MSVTAYNGISHWLLIELQRGRYMDLAYERGSDIDPKGHAFLYFRNKSDSDEVWSTYVILLPISVDVSKYVPPFLMNQMPEVGPKDLSAFAFPPAPEKLESHQMLENIANIRDDDVLFAGSIDPSNISHAMSLVNDAVQEYVKAYSGIVGNSLDSLATDSSDEHKGMGVDEVLYGLMSEGDKLTELTKLISRLRFAVEGSDLRLIKETEEDIELLKIHLSDNYNVTQLIDMVKIGGISGSKLADLYLQRCYHLVQEEYSKLIEVDAQIKELESGS